MTVEEMRAADLAVARADVARLADRDLIEDVIRALEIQCPAEVIDRARRRKHEIGALANS